MGPHFKYIDKEEKHRLKEQLGISQSSRVLMITGGSNGASVINQEIARFAPKFLEKYSNLYIIHQTGRGKLVYTATTPIAD